nr:MAG TPA: hypothetical protein [Bacteriophage sp.]
MDDIMWITKHGVITISSQSSNEDINKISYTQEELSKKIDQAYNAGNGKELVYWANIYEEEYGFGNIIY